MQEMMAEYGETVLEITGALGLLHLIAIIWGNNEILIQFVEKFLRSICG
ncbi:MAG: hypothetical protein RR364_03390 [Lachnospiraceae bacterium]